MVFDNGWVIALVVLIVAFIVFAVFRTIDAHRQQVTTGKEELKGKTAVVIGTLDPEGTVSYEGELWTAMSDSGKIEVGEEVTITKLEGIKLLVTKK